jgi:hypothetical protein
VSVEAVAMPGVQQEIKGLAAVEGKGEWWLANHEIHSASVTGPWPHGERFVDVTNKPSGKRMKVDEVGLYTVRNGKIVREEFFYDAEIPAAYCGQRLRAARQRVWRTGLAQIPRIEWPHTGRDLG